MNFKRLAVLTIVISLVIFILALVYNVPVAYIPYGATFTEYIMYNVIFMSIEVVVLSFLFTHMINKSKLEFYGDISKILT